MSDTTRDAISVVHTVASLNGMYGGVSRMVPQLADALCEQGCKVSVVTVTDPAGSGAAVRPERAGVLSARSLTIAQRRLWSSEFPDLITVGFTPGLPRLLHDNGLWGYTNYAAARYARRHRTPLVISPHGMLEPWALGDKRLRKRVGFAVFQRKALETAALLMVTAESEFESVRRAGFTQPVAVVPIGVPMPQGRSPHSVHAQIRNLLFLSRIHPKKGLLALTEAWARVREPGWRIIIAGPNEGGHLAEVRASIERLKIGADFEFRGETEGAAKRALYQSADAFVLPTHSENFGIVVAEALSYGLPVLTTRGAPWAILPTIGAGWWVDCGVDGLVQGLRGLLATTARQRSGMGDAGRNYVANHLSWSRSAQLTLDAYAWVLGLRREVPAHVRIDR